MKKFLSVIVVLLLVVAAALWYFLNYRLDGIIENQIEMAGSRSLGSKVAVGLVQTNIRDGSLTISEITVANPPGYKNTHAFSLKNVEAAVDYSTLDVQRVVIDNPEIAIEEIGGRTNFDAMLAVLEAQPDRPAGQGTKEPVIVVRHFRMNESRAAFESESLGRHIDLELDAVEMNDLRGTPSEIAKVIATGILREVTSETAGVMVKAEARKKLEDVGRKAADKLRALLGDDEDG
ncbi:MAG: hypothetical protein RQ826_00555 [Xanthomonadales bacterium]|nr:hypothetical protein [Xanthomonadales bacterium]